MKLSKLSKISLLLFICFGLDKLCAIFRQLVIARQFGLSPELDVFNIANNLPDMLYTLISGGALSIALIPIMADVVHHSGKREGWKLFSSIANLSFLAALFLSLVIAIFAEPIVSSEVGIAPGFTAEQQKLVVNLMRLNLLATLIFSISGLIMGGLQANEHFLFPALAPILYNIGQIFGALILAPNEPYVIGPLTLPCFGMGIYGLVGGVLLGALCHLLIQVPALIQNQFVWYPVVNIYNPDVRRVLKVLAPRILSVFLVQLIFIVRDNYASRLASGSVTALSYGYMFQQLPETLIGTAIGTAILPSLSLYVSERDQKAFSDVIQKACRIAFAFSVGAAALMAYGISPLVQFAFGLEPAQNDLLMGTLRGYLVGLVGHCLLEIANRAFYAQEQAKIPLVGTAINLSLYISVGFAVYRRLDAPGISLTDSIAFSAQALFMLIMLAYSEKIKMRSGQCLTKTAFRSLLGGGCSMALCFGITQFSGIPFEPLVKCILGLICGLCCYAVFVIPEIKLLRKFE